MSVSDLRSRPWTVVTNWRDLEHAEAGGAELVCDELASRFAAAGHRVILLCAHVHGRPRTEQVHGYTVRRAGGRFTVYPLALLWLLLHRARIETILDSQNGIPFFTPLAVRRRTAVILLLHHIHQQQFALYFPPPVAALGRWLESTASRAVYADRTLIAVSPSTREGARRTLGLRGDIKVVPPGWRVSLDVHHASPGKTPTPTLVTVGRLVPHKRTHLALEAVAQMREAVPDVRLHVIGGGTELPRLQELARSLDIEGLVQFHPGCSDEERDDVVARSWLCLNASEGEGWGISVIEANALGTPVLAYQRPGLRDSIAPGDSGWLIGDEEPLAGAATEIITALRDPEVATRMSSQAYSWARRFTWTEMGRRVLEIAGQERRRLALVHPERRRRTDVSTVVHLPHQVVPTGWDPRLREGDSVNIEVDGVTVFLAGADIEASRAVLDRAGIRLQEHGAAIRYRVARRRDHLVSTKTWS